MLRMKSLGMQKLQFVLGPCTLPTDKFNAGRCFKFGQTTLEGHALAGEESFAINWRPDNSVWYATCQSHIRPAECQESQQHMLWRYFVLHTLKSQMGSQDFAAILCRSTPIAEASILETQHPKLKLIGGNFAGLRILSILESNGVMSQLF